jgi:hypothetical protein
MTTRPDPFLAALLSSLLPGDGDWPSAVDTVVPVWFGARLGSVPTLALAVDWLRASLPPDFAVRTPAQRITDLQACEAKDAARFATVVNEAFNGYYIDPAVLGVIERKTGFPARPPQPMGHRLEPFDPSILDGRKRPQASR